MRGAEYPEGLDLPELSQIGIVVKDLEKTIAYYETVLGVGPFVRSGKDFTLVFDSMEYRGQKTETEFLMAFASLGTIELELIQPLRGPSLYDEFLVRGGEGLHHLGFDVDDLEERLERYRSMGLVVAMSGRTEAGGFAYLETDKTGGVIFELVQRRKRRA